MIELAPEDELVIRLWRWDEERLRKDAETDYADQVALGYEEPYYSVSVFAMSVLADETVEAAQQRLLAHALEHRSARYVTFTTRSRIREAGFEMVLNEPPPSHYDVVLGTDLGAADVAALASVFNIEERVKVPK